MSGEVLLARAGEIATLTLSSPERLNALSLAMWEQLGAHARALGKDDSLRCIVIRGEGEKAFAAGADIAAFKDERSNSKQARKYGERIAGAMQAFATCRHPVVALIQGACVGGGLLVAAAADIRLCGESLALRRAGQEPRSDRGLRRAAGHDARRRDARRRWRSCSKAASGARAKPTRRGW